MKERNKFSALANPGEEKAHGEKSSSERALFIDTSGRNVRTREMLGSMRGLGRALSVREERDANGNHTIPWAGTKGETHLVLLPKYLHFK